MNPSNRKTVKPTKRQDPIARSYSVILEAIYTAYDLAPKEPDTLPPVVGTATFVRSVDDFRGDARLYRCEPAFDADGLLYEYVIVSTIHDDLYNETLIFPSNGYGTVVDWNDLEGSFQGDTDHERALRNAGYVVPFDAPDTVN